MAIAISGMGPTIHAPLALFMMAFNSMYRYASLSWRQRRRGFSDFNGMLAGFFGNILMTVRTPLLRSRLPSIFSTP